MAFWANLTLLVLFAILNNSSDARYIRSLDEVTEFTSSADEVSDDPKETKSSIAVAPQTSEKVLEEVPYGEKEQEMVEKISEREETGIAQENDEIIEERIEEEDKKYSQVDDSAQFSTIEENVAQAQDAPSNAIAPQQEKISEMIEQEQETYEKKEEDPEKKQHLARKVELSDDEAVAESPLETESSSPAEEYPVQMEIINNESIESNDEEVETDILEEIEEEMEEQIEQTLQSRERVIENTKKLPQYLLWYISPEEAANQPSSRVVVPRIQLDLPFELSERFQEMNNALSEQLTELQKTLTNFFRQFTQRT